MQTQHGTPDAPHTDGDAAPDHATHARDASGEARDTGASGGQAPRDTIERKGNELTGTDEEQPASGLRRELGERDGGDADEARPAGGVGKSL